MSSETSVVKEAKEAVDSLKKAFHDFRVTNDERIKQIEAKGYADPLLEQQVDKANADIAKLSDELKALTKAHDNVELAINRGTNGGKGGDEIKALAEFQQYTRGRVHSADSLTVEGFRAYKKAFASYLRRGDSVPADIRAAMSVGSDPDGGFYVTPDTSGTIVQKIFETSPIRQIAAVQTISTDALEGYADTDEQSAGWVAETGARSDSTTPQGKKYRIPVFEMYSQPSATQQLLDDASIDIEAWLAGKVADKLARLENTAFVSGNGVTQPRGFLDYTTAATADSARSWGTLEHVATGTSGGFGTDPNGSDKLIDLMHKLKSAYRNGAVWVMNRATLGAARKLKANGEYIWLPSMTAGQNSQLLGFQVVEAEDMPAIAANSLSIAFGNFKVGYQIVDRQGIRTLRDPFTNKPYVRFYTTRRVGGDVLNFEAIKFLKFAA